MQARREGREDSITIGHFPAQRPGGFAADQANVKTGLCRKVRADCCDQGKTPQVGYSG